MLKFINKDSPLTYYSTLFKSSAIYIIATFFNASVPFFLLPILTRELTAADYGVISMFQLFLSFLYPFVGLNLEGAISRQYYNNVDSINFSKYISNCIIVSYSISLIIFVLINAFAQIITKYSSVPVFWLNIAFLCALFQFTSAIILAVWRVKNKPIQFGLFQIGLSLLNFLITLLFVVYMKKKWQGRLDAQLLSLGIFYILSWIILIKKLDFSFNIDIAKIKHALKFGVPLIPHAVGGLTLALIDRFFLTNMVDLSQTGNYTVAYQVGSLVNLITMSVNNAYVPWLYERLSHNDYTEKKKIVRFTYLYSLLLTIGCLLFIIIGPPLIHILIGKNFTNVNDFLPWIVMGFVFQGFYFMVTNYIMYSEKTYVQAWITLSIALLKLPITYYLIKINGPVGAAQAFCITFLLFFSITWLYSNKVYKMPWNLSFSHIFRSVEK